MYMYYMYGHLFVQQQRNVQKHTREANMTEG